MGFENGKLVRVAVSASAADQTQVNTFHYDLVDDVGLPANDPQSLADKFRDDVIPKFRLLYAAYWTINPVVVMQEKDPQNPNAARSEWQSGTPAAGLHSFGDQELPMPTCAVATLPTDHVGRRYRGRLFLGGTTSEVDQNGGVWQSGALGRWQDYLDSIPRQPDIAPGASGSTCKWGVYSRTNRAADIDPYISPVGTPVLHTTVHWLRSRTP